MPGINLQTASHVYYGLQGVTAWEALACVHSCADALLSTAETGEDSQPGVLMCLPAFASRRHIVLAN